MIFYIPNRIIFISLLLLLLFTIGFSAKDIAKNPAMARMFVLAAKKMKEIQIREGAPTNNTSSSENNTINESNNNSNSNSS